MFKLNFKIAFRNICKNSLSSFINVAGLSVGMASCLLLLMYAHQEWNHDKQFKQATNTYQAMVNLYDDHGEVTRTIGLSANVLAATLKESFPEIMEVSRTTSQYDRLIARENNSLKVKSRYADPAFLKVFNFEFIHGHPERALSAPNSIVLTESTALRFFGTTNVLNKALTFENQAKLKVTGVIKDLPANITYGFEALTPWALFENLNSWPANPNWGNKDFFTLITLRPEANIDGLNNKLNGFVAKHNSVIREDVFLYPLHKLHLYGDFANGKAVGGQIQQVRLFVGLSFGILLIACINFVNLSTAHAKKRAKEVGVKKVIGASRRSLIYQFLLESFLLTAISMIFAITFVELSLPWFNHLLDIKVAIEYFNPYYALAFLGFLVLTSGLAGFYPAFYLSRFNAMQAFKQQHKSGGLQGISLRQVMVVLQFSFAVMLIALTITIYKQLNAIKNRPLGYESNALVEIPHEGLLYQKYDLLKTRLLASGAVTAVTQSSNSVTNKDSSIRGLLWPGMPASGKLVDFDQIYTTYDFLKTTGINIIVGRDFKKEIASDSAALLLSSKAVKVMNLQQPLGAQIVYQGEKRHVVGVFEEIVWGDRSKFSAPMVIAFADGISDVITMRLNPEKSVTESTNMVNEILQEINPNFPVDIRFIDHLNELKLKKESNLATLAQLFGGLAISISCFGLYGLSAYSAVQRTKEIGVRKVLGASVTELMQLLSFSFLKLVFIAMMVSFPVSYYLMKEWLSGFEIQTTISLSIFLLTAGFTLLLSLFTVSWQTYRAATANPVNALKYE
ncbi:ABC-type antimicrobial peptide transport system permease subunit [Pedobacter sp. CAN_A7]|uniref:ABC transporter permease n=1 Tax=Pedobacter sp. CAN_A7 TaxID=2787722 RepID=UPI0018C8E635